MGFKFFKKKNKKDLDEKQPELEIQPAHAPAIVPRINVPRTLTNLGEDINQNDHPLGRGGEYDDPQFIVVNYLYDICQSNGWTKLVNPFEPCVVKLSSSGGNQVKYRYLPACDDIAPNSFVDCSARYLRADVVVRVSFTAIHSILELLNTDKVVCLDADCNIQIIDTMASLQWARKYQNCSFVKDEKCLVVWGDSVKEVTLIVTVIEKKMMDYIWKKCGEVHVDDEKYVPKVTFAAAFKNSYSSFGSNNAIEEVGENVVTMVGENRENAVNELGSAINVERSLSTENLETNEKDLEAQYEERPIFYVYAVVQAIAIMLVFTWIGLCMSLATREIRAQGNYYVLFIIFMLPVFLFFCSFFASSLVSAVLYIFGPISQMSKNSYSYSVIKSPRLKSTTGPLPHVTVQCPVYKENLETVIKPTIKSIQAAVRTYELQGGSVNIFINDDGLQLIDRKDVLERIEFYELCGIGYVARPPHGENGFVRKGRFKKASNMNYCLHISRMVDDRFYNRLSEKESWSAQEESTLYLNTLQEVVQEEGKCWAGGDILLGEVILLIDSDTRVPEDCFVDSVSEMHCSPEVAIIQHASGVMMVINNYWEKLIAWFTDMIYFSISCVSGNGLTMAAFVGHNAFLRWSAIQELAYVDEDDGLTKYWSESHVSEDFEMSLKLGALGYTIRIATYHNRQFLEGVSLTVYDEITRWSKYAYGCAEIMFAPFKDWWRGKIFTEIFFMCLRSRMSYACKFGLLGYIGTYYAIASSLIMLFANYFIVGYYDWGYIRVYVDSMQIFISVTIVFGVASQIAYIIGRYRILKHKIFPMILEIRYSVLFCIFLGGLAWHMVVAIGCYFFSINLQWGATAKDIEESNFFKELPRALKSYKCMFILSFMTIAGMIVLAYGVPYAYQIRMVACSLPLGWTVASHILSPIVLNPQLMAFAW